MAREEAVAKLQMEDGNRLEIVRRQTLRNVEVVKL